MCISVRVKYLWLQLLCVWSYFHKNKKLLKYLQLNLFVISPCGFIIIHFGKWLYYWMYDNINYINSVQYHTSTHIWSKRSNKLLKKNLLSSYFEAFYSFGFAGNMKNENYQEQSHLWLLYDHYNCNFFTNFWKPARHPFQSYDIILWTGYNI